MCTGFRDCAVLLSVILQYMLCCENTSLKQPCASVLQMMLEAVRDHPEATDRWEPHRGHLNGTLLGGQTFYSSPLNWIECLCYLSVLKMRAGICTDY